MEKISIALDWTPNTNHTGFFVALEKGWYREKGLEVEIRSPAADNYATTPAKKVELGQVDLALCPMESVISYRTKRRPFDLIAIAALLQEDVSAIACPSRTGIGSPRDLDGKRYASYQARYEDEIVRQMIRNDGGAGNLEIVYPDKLGIWETILKGRAEATWIFLNWEALQAEAAGVSLQLFKMKDYGIPYSYSPVLAGSAREIEKRRAVYRRFLSATRTGFHFAGRQPAAAADILAPYVPEGDRNIDLEQSQRFLAPFYGNEQTWGRMHAEAVDRFLAWLSERGLELQPLSAAELTMNDLLPAE